MPRHLFPFAALLCLAFIFPAPVRASADTDAPASEVMDAPDSVQMEKDLQQLPWTQFRAVIEAIPKLKADVDAYGSLGWQLVQASYTSYGWKKNIDRLDDDQKKRLAELIQSAKRGR